MLTGSLGLGGIGRHWQDIVLYTDVQCLKDRDLLTTCLSVLILFARPTIPWRTYGQFPPQHSEMWLLGDKLLYQVESRDRKFQHIRLSISSFTSICVRLSGCVFARHCQCHVTA